MRRRLRWLFAAILLLLVAGYFATRLLSAVAVDQPVETKAGLQQRAAAAQKLIRYNDWLGSFVGRSMLGPVLLWPLAPSEAEAAAAGEFASAVVGAQRQLGRAGFACGDLPQGSDGLSEEEVAMVAAVAEHVRAADTQWADPPTVTLMVPIRARFPCAADAATGRASEPLDARPTGEK